MTPRFRAASLVSVIRVKKALFIFLAASALLLSASNGFAFLGFPAGGTFRAVSQTPFLDRPGQLTLARLIYPVDDGTLAAVVVKFGGQALRVESINMDFSKPAKGTLREILGGVLEPYKFDLFEVRSRNGKRLGYILVHTNRLNGHYLEKGGTLVLKGAGPRAAGEDD